VATHVQLNDARLEGVRLPNRGLLRAARSARASRQISAAPVSASSFTFTAAFAAFARTFSTCSAHSRFCSSKQGIKLVHFSAQLEPFLTQ
jgi:hypothetical protein